MFSHLRRDRENLVILGHRAYILEYIPLHPGAFLITGAAETNIVVRIRGGIVQIQCEHTRVTGIIPIAAALKRVQFSLSY